jgi:hypothetical protein
MATEPGAFVRSVGSIVVPVFCCQLVFKIQPFEVDSKHQFVIEHKFDRVVALGRPLICDSLGWPLLAPKSGHG